MLPYLSLFRERFLVLVTLILTLVVAYTVTQLSKVQSMPFTSVQEIVRVKQFRIQTFSTQLRSQLLHLYLLQ